MRIRIVFSLLLAVTARLAGQNPPPSANGPAKEQAPASSAGAPGDNRTRLELNLLGKENTAGGESRRNENVQFNLVDNNTLKELNVRLGATATIVEEFKAELSFYGSEFGNPPSAVVRLTQAARANWHGNVFFNHQNSIFSARSFFQAGDVKPAHENRYGFTTGITPWRGGYITVHGGQEKLRGFVNGNVLVPTPDERIP